MREITDHGGRNYGMILDFFILLKEIQFRVRNDWCAPFEEMYYRITVSSFHKVNRPYSTYKTGMTLSHTLL